MDSADSKFVPEVSARYMIQPVGNGLDDTMFARYATACHTAKVACCDVTLTASWHPELGDLHMQGVHVAHCCASSVVTSAHCKVE